MRRYCREEMDLDARTTSENILVVTRGIDDWHPASTKASRHEDSYGQEHLSEQVLSRASSRAGYYRSRCSERDLG